MPFSQTSPLNVSREFTKRLNLFLVCWKNYLTEENTFSSKRDTIVCVLIMIIGTVQTSHMPFILSNCVINQARLLCKLHSTLGHCTLRHTVHNICSEPKRTTLPQQVRYLRPTARCCCSTNTIHIVVTVNTGSQNRFIS
jgi:hypothetical protein